VAQEALANAARHSRARQVGVELVFSRNRVHLSVTDTGIGFDPARVKAGLGLAGMQERVTRADGQISIAARPGRGVRVQLVLPLPRRAAGRAVGGAA
jgi:signal transduction histidine kinase